jgi:hypothetical protein
VSASKRQAKKGESHRHLLVVVGSSSPLSPTSYAIILSDVGLVVVGFIDVHALIPPDDV